MNIEDIGVFLKTTREIRGISLREIAGKANLSASTVSRIERGLASHAQVNHLSALAEALGYELYFGLREKR